MRSESVRRSGSGTRSGREERRFELAGRITERDRAILRLLYEHRVLTTAQVADIGFPTVRKAQERLAILFDLEAVDRFRPRSYSGSNPFHFVLGTAGAAVIAAEQDVEISDLHWNRNIGSALGASSHLPHLVGSNGFFTALVRVARERGDGSLVEWWSDRRCAAEWGEVVRPDGYAVWVEGEKRLPFLFEYDRASERLARLEAKLPGYAALARAAKHPTWVLFCFPTNGRGAAARQVLGHPEVAVATAVLAPGQAPDTAVWLVVGETGPRRRLADLGHPARALELARSQ